FQGRERDVRDESASVCLGGAGRQCIEAVLPLATDEVRVDVRAPSRSAVFRYGQQVTAVQRVFTRHTPLVSKSGRLSRVHKPREVIDHCCSRDCGPVTIVERTNMPPEEIMVWIPLI